MKITLPYHYSFTYVKVGYRNPETRFADASVEIEFREVEADQAPVVMKVGNPKSSRAYYQEGAKQRFSVKEDGSLREIRVIGGAYYVEEGSVEELLKNLSDPFTVSKTFLASLEIIKIVDGKDSSGTAAKILTPTTTIALEKAKHPYRTYKGDWQSIKPDQIRDDGGREMAERIKRACSTVIFVNGKTYRRCPEPVLTLEGYSTKTVVITGPGTSYSGSNELQCSMLSAQAFIDYIRNNEDMDPGTALPQFELTDDYWSRFDGFTKYTLESVNRLIGALNSELATLSRSQVEAYFALKEAMDNAKKEPHCVTPQLAAALARLSKKETPADKDRQLAIANFDRAVRIRELQASGAHYHSVKPSLTMARMETESSPLSKRTDFSEDARAILDRWRSRPRADFVGTKPTAKMVAQAGDFTIKELVSRGAVISAAESLQAPAREIVNDVTASDRVFIVKDRNTGLSLLGKQTGNEPAVVLASSFDLDKAAVDALYNLLCDPEAERELSLAKSTLKV